MNPRYLNLVLLQMYPVPLNHTTKATFFRNDLSGIPIYRIIKHLPYRKRTIRFLFQHFITQFFVTDNADTRVYYMPVDGRSKAFPQFEQTLFLCNTKCSLQHTSIWYSLQQRNCQPLSFPSDSLYQCVLLKYTSSHLYSRPPSQSTIAYDGMLISP